MTTKLFTTVLLFFLLNAGICGQNTGNPFELAPRLSPSERQPDTFIQGQNTLSGNPFEIRPDKGKKKPAAEPALTEKEVDHHGSFLFGVLLFSMVLLTLMFMAFRPVIEKIYRAATNDNMLTQVYRERKTGGGGPYFMVYAMYVINAGIFVFLILNKYKISITEGFFYELLLCIGVVLAASLFKYLILSLIGYIFPVHKETGLYSFTILVFSVIIGLVLVPANLIIAYAPAFLANATLWFTLVLIGLLYLFRAGRALFIANRFLIFHKFHFLLYICTVEIAPVLVVIKLITNGLPL